MLILHSLHILYKSMNINHKVNLYYIGTYGIFVYHIIVPIYVKYY